MCVRSAFDAGGSHPDRRKSKPRNRRGLRPDGRSMGARRLKALIVAYSADLGGELTTQVDKALVRTAAILTLKMEMLEHDLASGKVVSSDDLIRLASTSRRALAAVSAKAVNLQPASQTLQQYLAAKHASTPQPDDDEGEA
jgi:hypothetical protein